MGILTKKRRGKSLIINQIVEWTILVHSISHLFLRLIITYIFIK